MQPSLDANLRLPFVIQQPSLPLCRDIVAAAIVSISLMSSADFVFKPQLRIAFPVTILSPPLRLKTPLKQQSQKLMLARVVTIAGGYASMYFAFR